MTFLSKIQEKWSKIFLSKYELIDHEVSISYHFYRISLVYLHVYIIDSILYYS